ncbi:MAG: hypothetical protein ACJ702_08525 [Nitrososphaeraceae archaeon]
MSIVAEVIDIIQYNKTMVKRPECLLPLREEGLTNNPEISAAVRVQPHHLAAELEHAIFKLSYETPAMVARQLSLSNSNKLV